VARPLLTRVDEPLHGAVVAGDPYTINLQVSGRHDDASRSLAIQILADPDDLQSWTSIGSAQVDATSHRFSVDVRPVQTLDDEARWPKGGVLRLRVVDDTGVVLPYDAEGGTVLAVVNPAPAPTGWAFLVEKPPGSPEETAAYYAAIDAPPTLTDFITQFTADDETTARYYNTGDLGIGREMHCNPTPANGLACYVRNFGTFGGDPTVGLDLLVEGGTPLATVAMVYAPPIEAPNAVTFMVYGGDGALVQEAQLDTRGDNTSIPQNCLNCHGGRSSYDAQLHAATGARFLPFDPSAFAFSQLPGLTLAAQESDFRTLDRMVADAAPTAATRELIDGLFPADNSFDPGFVPVGWRGKASDARIYREVVAPYCRGCHTSFANGPNDPAAFTTAASLRAQATNVIAKICGGGPLGMPAAEQTTASFFRSSARALLVTWLGAASACAP